MKLRALIIASLALLTLSPSAFAYGSSSSGTNTYIQSGIRYISWVRFAKAADVIEAQPLLDMETGFNFQSIGARLYLTGGYGMKSLKNVGIGTSFNILSNKNKAMGHLKIFSSPLDLFAAFDYTYFTGLPDSSSTTNTNASKFLFRWGGGLRMQFGKSRVYGEMMMQILHYQIYSTTSVTGSNYFCPMLAMGMNF